MKTWDEMYNYLIEKDNCAVHGEAFICKDLHHTLKKLDSMIKLHPVEVRNKSVYCMSLKGSLERIFTAYLQGRIFEVGYSPVKPFSTKIV